MSSKEEGDAAEESQTTPIGIGYVISLAVLFFFGLLLHQSPFGMIIDGGIGYVITKYYIDRFGVSIGNVIVATLLFFTVFFASAYIIGAVARTVFGVVFN